jgi:hypothetical protein
MQIMLTNEVSRLQLEVENLKKEVSAMGRENSKLVQTMKGLWDNCF